MNNIIANIRTQVQKLKCRIANLSNRVTYIEDNCCSGGGDSEINDWEPQEYPEGAIVTHNGGIWRSNVDGNEDEPVICNDSIDGWELIDDIKIHEIYLGSSPETYLDINEGDFVFTTIGAMMVPYNMTLKRATTFIPAGTPKTDLDLYLEGTYYATGDYPQSYELFKMNMSCSDALNSDGVFYIKKTGLGGDATYYQLNSCPYTNLSSPSFCPWTLLAQVNSENGIQSIQEGDNISIDNTDPQNPIISALGGEQQFVQITEDGKTGWGLKYRADNPDRYGNIGNYAIDLSINAISSAIGATGIYSTISGGQYNAASGGQSTVSGGSSNTASGSHSTISGGYTNTASGMGSIISGGYYNTANSFGEWVGGMYGTTPSGQSATSWEATDRLFNIGNGESLSIRSDAFTILKNGLATLPSVTNTLIDEELTGKAVVTKEWSNANTMINPTLIAGYDAGETQTLKNVNGVLTWITD